MDKATMQQNTGPPPPLSRNDDTTMNGMPNMDTLRKEMFDVTNIVGQQCNTCQQNRWADCDILTQAEGQRCTQCKVFAGTNNRCSKSKISMNDACYNQADNRADKRIPPPKSRKGLPRNEPYDTQPSLLDYDVMINKTSLSELSLPPMVLEKARQAILRQQAEDRKNNPAPQPPPTQPATPQAGNGPQTANGQNPAPRRATAPPGTQLSMTYANGTHVQWANNSDRPMAPPPIFGFMFEAGNGYDAGYTNQTPSAQGYGNPTPLGGGVNTRGRGGGVNARGRGGGVNARGRGGGYRNNNQNQNRSHHNDGGRRSTEHQGGLQAPPSGPKRRKINGGDSDDRQPRFAAPLQAPDQLNTPNPAEGYNTPSVSANVETEADRQAKKRSVEESQEVLQNAREHLALNTSREVGMQTMEAARQRLEGMPSLPPQQQPQAEDRSMIHPDPAGLPSLPPATEDDLLQYDDKDIERPELAAEQQTEADGDSHMVSVGEEAHGGIGGFDEDDPFRDDFT